MYENIQINYRLLETCEGEFISSEIMDNIIHCNANQYEREGYITDLNDDNFENDLDVAIAGTGIERDYINSGCI